MGEKFHFQAKGMPLIKFQDADKIKSLQAGKIYAKTLGYYRKREEETENAPVEVTYRRIENMFGRNEPLQYSRGEAIADDKHDCRHS